MSPDSKIEWQNTIPPNEQIVEVELDGNILKVIAFFGRDGYLPHWQTPDGRQSWPANKFDKWRPVNHSCSTSNVMEHGHYSKEVNP